MRNWMKDVSLPLQNLGDLDNFVSTFKNYITEIELDRDSRDVAVYIAEYINR